jgi:hypothetical protein
MSAFTLSSRETVDRLRKFIRDAPAPPDSIAQKLPHKTYFRTKRNRANGSLLNRKRFEATEDRSRYCSACAAQSATEVMHPISISRELAQENQDRPGIA